MNEIWLDFTTDAAGKGMADRTVDFKVRPGEAKAIVIHAMMTGSGGVAAEAGLREHRVLRSARRAGD
jgi:Cu-Zn family superoxide dismutase